MCNNIAANKLRKQNEEIVVKDKIKDWIENRPTLSRNVLANKNREVELDRIKYAKGYPLKLHDGTRIHSINITQIDEIYTDVCVKFRFKKENKDSTCHIKRYVDDDIDELETFLANSQSIVQLRNIDLKYK